MRSISDSGTGWVTGQLLLVDGGQSLLGLPRYLEGLEQAGAPGAGSGR
jgi:hypothetical protein